MIKSYDFVLEARGNVQKCPRFVYNVFHPAKSFFSLTAHKLKTLTMILLFSDLKVFFLKALPIIKIKWMAVVCTTRNGELFHYLFPAFRSLMGVINCRCCSTSNNFSPMMLMFRTSNPDHRIDAFIWILGCSTNTPVKVVQML